ncbi:putative glutathione S-transferase [Aspergillus ellipticus CBS 707.79]|uniref:Putative glutathione S-transferase n=1 Tax=Aspergillus ellipticus CBS 707.79 TaxID=1448320 RepID=A0A319DW80_9EURO|nr:putative glutathione S-transferase [Aspergillus ellipticus CBS 707.79]
MPLPSTKPTLHYFDIGGLGRGEVIRLFLKDAGVEFNDIRFPFDSSWPATSAELKEKGLSVTGKVPVLEYEGKILHQHLPILRYLARELGEYDGSTSFEKYVLDAVSDIYNDWRTEWVNNIANATDAFKNDFVPRYYSLIEGLYAQHEGPYLLGERIAYVDFAVYQSIHNNEKIGAKVSLPEPLAKLKAAFEARPTIAAYLASRDG